MDVYFDKENLTNFICEVMDHSHLFDVNDMIMEQCDIFLSCEREEWMKQYSERENDNLFENNEITKKDEIKEKISTWMRKVTDGSYGHKIKFSSPFPFDKLNTFCENNYKLYTSVILQNRKNFIDNKTEGKGLLCSSNPVIGTLQKLFIGGRYIPSKIFYMRDEQSRKMLYNNMGELPCTDIIIVDPWVFANPDKKPYGNNIYALISHLCNSIKENMIVNVVFYTYDYYKDEKGKRINPLFENIRNEITSMLRDINHILANVTFIKPLLEGLSDDDLVHVQQHDRYIITNYQILNSGNSFNYYNQDLEYISKGTWTTLSTICDRDNFDVFCKLLSDIQLAINKCPKCQYSHNDPELFIYGDMKSNLLNFNHL